MAPSTKKFRVAGVPEAFNLGIMHLEEDSKASGSNSELRRGLDFITVGGGTGALVAGLKEGKYDMIVALTEGLVCKIAQGEDLVLLGTMVESPLCWAVSAAPDAPFQSFADLKGQTFGISRFTSGSHLMVSCEGRRKGWNVNDIPFSVENDFAGLRNSVKTGRSAAFLWEKYTTKPFHDRGELKKIDEIYTPWPAFMIATKRSSLQGNKQLFARALRELRRSSYNLLKRDEIDVAKEVSHRFGMRVEDALEWWKDVRITATPTVRKESLDKALAELEAIGQIAGKQAELASANDYEKLVYKPLTDVVHWPKRGRERASKLMHMLDTGVDNLKNGESEHPESDKTKIDTAEGRGDATSSPMETPSESSLVPADGAIEFAADAARRRKYALSTRMGRGGWLPDRQTASFSYSPEESVFGSHSLSSLAGRTLSPRAPRHLEGAAQASESWPVEDPGVSCVRGKRVEHAFYRRRQGTPLTL